jgi:hypothetical protein
MVKPMTAVRAGRAIVCSALAMAALGPAVARGAETARWLGDDLPLPLTVKTPQDIGFKTATERQYLIFNLMAGGKLAFQHGDFAVAVEKWETLMRVPGLDPQVQLAVAPLLAEARARIGSTGAPAAPGAGRREPVMEPAIEVPAPATSGVASPDRTAVHHRATLPGSSVAGSVTGGGQIGPGGAVVWLKRLDGPMPHLSPPSNQIITQREKTFLPHVLAIPAGTTVQFRNDDRIYHNVFSIAKPNDFDAGIRASGATYTRTFSHAGAVQLLCNIHSTMSAYVFVVDSPLYAKAQASGAFVIRGVAPGRYELSAWHEAASTITRKTVTVGPDGLRDVGIAVAGDKRPGPFVPDKYGHKRQPQLGY